MIVLDTDDTDIERAVALIREGRLVAFPTETVYGLGADAMNAHAVAGIFRAKGRPADHPVIVHVDEAAMMPRYARAVPHEAYVLAEHFWPGPLTLILTRAESVPAVVTGGQETVGMRVPGHTVALKLLHAFGGGLAAPSANPFGRLSPTTAAHVVAAFGDEVAAVVDGGPCTVGVESTIVDLTGPEPAVLRAGMISVDAIAQALGRDVRVGRAGGPRVSGALASHYAPATPLVIVESDALEKALAQRCDSGQSVGALVTTVPPAVAELVYVRTLPSVPGDYARGLYAALHELDALDITAILVERPPRAPGWEAVHDRLDKAASGTPDDAAS